jgi:hypothetical protein
MLMQKGGNNAYKYKENRASEKEKEDEPEQKKKKNHVKDVYAGFCYPRRQG